MGSQPPCAVRTRRLLTVGHGTAPAAQLTALLVSAGVHLVVDVGGAPGSRRNPQFSRGAMESSLPAAGIGYRWERRLGGFRRPAADSPNVARSHPAFRGSADYMGTEPFRDGLATVLGEPSGQATAIMRPHTP